jgi:hypothetical protein
MADEKARRLQGKVLSVEKIDESFVDEDNNTWEKCIFTVEITGFSKRTPEEEVPKSLMGKQVKLVRWCSFDWHYKIGVRKTLEPDETEAVIRNTPIETVYW